jgi:ElaB/YqjD/DUF883 family membrane-anchored ribosome-binding protein
MNEDNDIRALREDIEQTRMRIAAEVGAIGDRLTPEHAKEMAMLKAKEKIVEAKDRAMNRARESVHTVTEGGANAGRRLGRAARDNPIPTAMVCAGTGWLLWRAFSPNVSTRHFAGEADERNRLYAGGELEERSRATELKERAKHRTAEVKDRAKQLASQTKERVAHRTEDLRHRANDLYSTGRERSQEAWVSTQDKYDRNPLLFGVAVVAAGVGVAMLLPHTEREDRALGKSRDKVMDRARDVASQAKDVATESAREGMRVAKETAKREAKGIEGTSREPNRNAPPPVFNR